MANNNDNLSIIEIFTMILRKFIISEPVQFGLVPSSASKSVFEPAPSVRLAPSRSAHRAEVSRLSRSPSLTIMHVTTYNKYMNTIF